MTTVRDETKPEGKWVFDAAVADAFDDMLARSIPEYVQMRKLCFSLGCKLVKDGTAIIDLGCSRGEALAPFVNKFGAFNSFIGVEVSEPMLAICRSRFKGLINVGIVDIRNLDLRASYPPMMASLTLCVLTLQFTPIEYRQKIVRNVFKHTVSGGGLLLVEKVMGAFAETNDIMVEEYCKIKEENGYTKDQIDRKKLALEGVLVPVTAKWNEELLCSAGFRQVECFWRFLNFAGWLAIKE